MKATVERAVSTGRVVAAFGTLAAEMPDSGVVNSEYWRVQSTRSLWEDLWWWQPVDGVWPQAAIKQVA